MRNMIKIWTACFLFGLAVSGASWAGALTCAVCEMNIADGARTHFVLKGDSKEMHVCSVGCVKKARKHDANLSKLEVANFNAPSSFISGDKAFYLVKSEKLKADLGEVMPPYFGAFSTKKEADAARGKYGDGHIVQGFDAIGK